MRIGETIRMLRTYHDLKQRDLAERLGLGRSYMSEIEKERKVPTLDVIQRVAAEFEIPPSSLVYLAEVLAMPRGSARPPLPSPKMERMLAMYHALEVR